MTVIGVACTAIRRKTERRRFWVVDAVEVRHCGHLRRGKERENVVMQYKYMYKYMAIGG